MNCLESSFIIDFLDPQKENHEEAVKWMEENRDQPLATITICAYEVLRGAARINQSKEHVEDFLRALRVPSFDFESSVKAAETDAELHSQGNPLSARDTLIASQARQLNYTLITHDKRFEDVPGLRVRIYI